MRKAIRHRSVPNSNHPTAANSGRRLPRINFFGSIRFRLTAWYTLALVIILAVLGLLLSTFLTRALENQVDNRLQTASKLVSDPLNYGEVIGAGGLTDALRVQVRASGELQALVSSGLFYMIANLGDDEVVDEGGVPPPDMLDSLEYSSSLSDNGEFRMMEFGDQRWRIFIRTFLLTPVDTPDEAGAPLIGAIIVGESLERQEQVLTLLNQLLRTAGAAGVLLATWGGWILAGRALAPVNRIASTANAIARQGDAQESLSTRLEVNDSGDELARLSLAINAMLERIERAFRAQRRFVADASHELRTPLTAIRGNVDVLYRHAKSGREIAPEDLQESLGDMRRESARMARLIDDLLMLARTDAEGLGHMVNPEPVELDVIAREAFRTAESLAQGQRLHLTIRQPLMIYGDGDRLAQVMIILLDNAIRHTPPGGTVDLIIDAAETEDGKLTSARIQVVDSGEGIPEEHLPHLFERFYRVEGSRSRLAGGSGLGLAIALAIVRGHNGWIDVESPEEKGTHITVWLPILESPSGVNGQIPMLPGYEDSQRVEAGVTESRPCER